MVNMEKCKNMLTVWRNIRVPYMNNRVYLYAILSICIIVILVSYNQSHKPAAVPNIREGNMNLKNKYGTEGQQRLPHAIVIGVRKGGTRAILSYLKRHPDIRVARSEVHFFGVSTYTQGLEWYRHIMPFSRADQITVEKTPAYFHLPDAPGQIHQMNSSVKLILLVRDPIERAQSDYIQSQPKHWYFNTPLFNTFEKVSNPNGLFSGFVWRSTYIEILQEWLKYFRKEQILILDSGRLVKDPITEMHKVETFLGVKHFLGDNIFVLNEETHFYCIKNTGKPGTHCLGKSKGRPHPEIDPEVKRKLQEYFRPYNERLFELIGERLDWNNV